MEILETELTKMLGIKFPIIMAPMFLVSNTEMVIEATRAGITGAIPSLNYRTDEEFRQALKEMKSKATGPIGINLIVNKSNFRLKEQLAICVEAKIDFIITSLGNPKLVIEKCKKHDIKVFCDVTEEVYAKKVEQLGADALIAVNSSAGGHAGNIEAKDRSCKSCWIWERVVFLWAAYSLLRRKLVFLMHIKRPLLNMVKMI